MKIKCKSFKDDLTIEEPNGEGKSYLWIGLNGKYIGSVESVYNLKKLQTIINRVLKHNAKLKKAQG